MQKEPIKTVLNICRWFFLGLYTIVAIIPQIPRSFVIGLMTFLDPKKANDIRYKGKPVIPMMILSLSLSVYLICVFISSRWYVQKLKTEYLANDIIESTKMLEDEKQEEISTETYTPNENDEYNDISFLSVDFTELLKQNKDTVGWIKVNNTKVNYSIVQTTDNEYYLKHDFNKRRNSSGWVYADYRDNLQYFGNNSILYAHNTLTKTMFSTLTWCTKKSWYENTENHFIKLSTPYTNTIWKIFSIYTRKPELYYLTTYFESEADHQKFIDTLLERSIYNFDTPVTTEDRILTLSTCTDDGKKRVVIHAKMIKVEYR